MKAVYALACAAVVLVPTLAHANPDKKVNRTVANNCTYFSVDSTNWRVRCIDEDLRWARALWNSGGGGDGENSSPIT